MPPKTTPPKDLDPEDFEKIREAVLETPRGRWFLNEFASRLRAAESASLMNSMKRLETAVAANHDALMERLAEALKRGPAPAQESAPQPELAPKHMKYYQQDEEIFTPAPHATIAEVPAATEEKPRKEERRRAARVIRRQGPAFEPPPEMEAPLPTAAAPAPEPSPPPAPGEPQPAAKRRIVIIRHKPGEDIDVPLAEELARAS